MQNHKHISQLPDSVISEIAAGEVVERPASIVKELIDNAIDAQASHISITLSNHGIEKIVVEDNGVGIPKNQLTLALTQHATSKLSTISDLTTLSTLGFRGEALATIGAVSSLSITSKTADSPTAHRQSLKFGTMSAIKTTAGKNGTLISVSNLFLKHPARKKFLASPATELAHILTVIETYATAYPEIAWNCSHNTTSLLSLPQKTIEKRVQALYSQLSDEQLIPFSMEEDHCTVTGWIGHPMSAKSSTAMQKLFVNNRPVSDKQISHSIKEAYGSLIEPKQHPIFILWLTASPSLVDVNIHPRKQTVRVHQSLHIQKSLTNAVRSVLENTTTIHYLNPKKDIYTPFLHTDSQLHESLRKSIKPWHPSQSSTSVTMQYDNVYVFANTPSGVLMVDQHAAHERILFEQFKEAYFEKNLLSIALKTPITFTPTSLQKSTLIDKKTELHAAGFTYQEQSEWLLEKIPALLSEANALEVFFDIVDSLEENNIGTSLPQLVERTLSYLACRTAIKEGEPLTTEQMQKIIEKLLTLDNNYTCPHGRPTHILLTRLQLDHWFKRR